MKGAFEKKEKVRFQHVDFAGIVFYPRFLEMVNCLVEDFYEEALGLPFSELIKVEGIPTVDLKIQFKKPAFLGDILTKYLWIKNIGTSSFTYGVLFEHADKSVCLQGEVTLVKVSVSEDRKNIKASPFSDELRAKFEQYIIE